MNVLILGGSQVCGPGLPEGKSYVAQFVRRLRVARQPVKIDHRLVTMHEAIRLLPHLSLSEYDCILLQFDLSLSWLPTNSFNRLLVRAQLGLKKHRFAQLKTLREQLARVLLQVRVFNRQVVLISPLPQQGGAEQQFIKLAQAAYVQESTEWNVQLFDVSTHLSVGDELFQAGSATNLSAVAHEVLGSELHIFITEPTYTPWS